MGQRQSRLSRADRDDGRTSSSSTEKTLCPSCGQFRLTTVILDDELPIGICEGCGRRYGVDDSMDFDTLALLLEHKNVCQVAEMSVETCSRCHNDDVDRFTIVGFDSVIHVECMDCFKVSDIPLANWDSDGLDGSSMAEVLASKKGGGDDEEGGWSDCDSGYVEVGVGAGEELFSCICCGNETAECFHNHFDAVFGDLTRVTCLVCDNEKVVESFFGVECGHCGNGRKELFEVSVDDYGRIARLRCFVCGKRLRLPGEAFPRKEKEPPASQASGQRGKSTASGARLGWTKISDLDEVKPGDQVAWHKWYAIWHHAIVVEVPDSGRLLTVIHYNGAVVKIDGHFAGVRLETIDVNPETEDLYRIDYPAGETYSAEEVIMRASDRIGEAKYNPFTNNCEHFARYCKTGRSECGQVRKFFERLRLVSETAATKVAQEAAVDGLESTAGRLGKIGVGAIRQRVGRVFGETAGAVRNVKCGALAFNVVVNLALEAAIFTKDAVVAYRRYKAGAISRGEFCRILCKLGCECAGGFVGGSATGILGQVLIPVPFVGGLIGCTLGSLIGRYTGAVIGKKLSTIKH